MLSEQLIFMSEVLLNMKKKPYNTKVNIVKISEPESLEVKKKYLNRKFIKGLYDTAELLHNQLVKLRIRYDSFVLDDAITSAEQTMHFLKFIRNLKGNSRLSRLVKEK